MTFNSGIDFEFGDSDSLLVELEELYSYAEVNDFHLNRSAAKVGFIVFLINIYS